MRPNNEATQSYRPPQQDSCGGCSTCRGGYSRRSAMAIAFFCAGDCDWLALGGGRGGIQQRRPPFPPRSFYSACTHSLKGERGVSGPSWTPERERRSASCKQNRRQPRPMPAAGELTACGKSRYAGKGGLSAFLPAAAESSRSSEARSLHGLGGLGGRPQERRTRRERAEPAGERAAGNSGEKRYSAAASGRERRRW